MDARTLTARSLHAMPSFPCVDCRQPVQVSNWDIAVPVVPETYVCGRCGASNILSRRTVLLVLGTSIGIGLIVSLANWAWVHVAPRHVGAVVGYAIGVGVGLGIASRYGTLEAPCRPRT